VELRHIKQFLAIIDTGSFGDAARRLGMAQPSLSASIRALEEDLGATLFLRSNAGTRPNAFGRVLERRARLMVAEAERAEQEIGELAGVRRGHVTLACAPIFAQFIVPEAVARFRAAHPGVDVTIIEEALPWIYAAVKDGKIDFGLASHPPDLPEGFSSAVLLKNYATNIVARADHPLATRRRVAPAELAEATWLLPAYSSAFRVKLLDLLAKAGLAPPASSVEYTTVTTARALMLRGGYVGPMSQITVGDEIAAGILAVIRVPELSWRANAGTIFLRDAPLLPAASKLVEFVRNVTASIQRKH
jgi:DNA-binding transcriptional LysR family regulator